MFVGLHQTHTLSCTRSSLAARFLTDDLDRNQQRRYARGPTVACERAHTLSGDLPRTGGVLRGGVFWFGTYSEWCRC